MKIFKLAAIAAELAVCISCSSDKPDNTNHYLQEMTGRYRLSEIYTDEPVDIDLNGTYNTDLTQEICMAVWPFEFLTAEITNNYYTRVSYNVPVYSLPEVYPAEPCFATASTGYYLDVSKSDGAVTITERPDNLEQERGTLQTVSYNNDTLHLIMSREFITADGWKPFVLHMVYKKDPSLN